MTAVTPTERDMDRAQSLADAAKSDAILSNLTMREAVVKAIAHAIASERERCAGIADENAVASPGPWGDGAVYNARKIAAAIRKGGEE